MEMGEVFIFDAGWVFFVAWGMVLAAISMIAFGQEILGFAYYYKSEQEKQQINH